MLVHGPYPAGEPRVRRQARAAVDAGWEVEVVAMRCAGEPGKELVDGAEVHRLPMEHRRGSGALGLMGEYLGFTGLSVLELARLSLRRRHDVVQVHAPPDFLLTAAAVPRLRGSRLILDVHDLSPDMFAMRFDGRRGAAAADAVLRRIERMAGRAVDAVITVHEPYRRELIALGIPPDRVHVVMNSLDEQLLPPRRERDGSGFRVVYHGTITPPYGVELLVEAAAKVLPDVPALQVEIYGEGDAVAGVERRIGELGLSSHIRLWGSLAHEDVLGRVAGADAGVVPNLPTRLNRYALSSKLFEYVALGVPVVVSRLPTLAEHFSPEEVLFFEAGDAESLAEALRDLARDSQAAAACVAAASARYCEYRWEAQRERYLALLRRLAPTEPVSS